jgi:uncharacterized protein (DUF1697 family)
MTRLIALLRAVNVGKRQLPMAELRTIATDLGFTAAATYVASGNLVFTAAEDDPVVAAARLEAEIAKRYGWKSEAILRTAHEWAAYAAGSAFPDVETERPKLLHLLLSQRPPAADAAAKLAERAVAGERIKASGDAIWIDFADGVGRSKLTVPFIDKCVGSPSTARNWNTVQALDRLARG